MARKTYEFKTGVVDFLELSGPTPRTDLYDWTFVTRTGTAGNSYTYPTGETTFANVKSAFDLTYPISSNLYNEVKAIGYGWQKWVVPRSMSAEIMVRGGCGGHGANINAVLDQSTGFYTDPNNLSNRGGRGAKLIGKIKLNKGDILYILVGLRGFCKGNEDHGGFGGGASCIFRENPLGSYTFTPVNKKVDVLMVAGGGGGAGDKDGGGSANNPTRMGGDASFLNGINTNGGLSRPGEFVTGGAGLTGNSTNGDMQPNFNLLSGTPRDSTDSRGTSNSIAATWGGGGCPDDPGGGGGGYSGGNSGLAPDNNERRGLGGTSYINPAYVTEVFRGYEADVSKNPYSIPGSIIISGGRDDDEKFLAQDSEGNKYWNPTTKNWDLIPTNPFGDILITDFINYGWGENEGLAGLVPGEVTFYCSSPRATKDLTIHGLARYQVVKSNIELNVAQIDIFRNWVIRGLHSSVSIKCAVSADYGITYQILSNYQWTAIDIDDRETFWGYGIPLTDLNTILNEKWKELRARSLRFAFIIDQNSLFGNPVLTGLDLNADLVGAWRKAIHGTQYDYEYIASDLVKIIFNQGGNYKVNYLDKVIESDEPDEPDEP